MKRRDERIERLTERYFAGETTVAEERELRAAAAPDAKPTTPEEALFAGLRALSGERMPAERPHTRPASERKEERPLRPAGQSIALRRWGGVLAAAALAAVGCFVLADAAGAPYCYVDGRPVRDRGEAIEAVEALACLEQLDAFGRQVEQFDELINR